jgi:hypothetical protein
MGDVVGVDLGQELERIAIDVGRFDPGGQRRIGDLLDGAGEAKTVPAVPVLGGCAGRQAGGRAACCRNPQPGQGSQEGPAIDLALVQLLDQAWDGRMQRAAVKAAQACTPPRGSFVRSSAGGNSSGASTG